MKKILILSNINSPHTQKWCSALAQAGYNIGIFTLSFPNDSWYESFANIQIFCPVRFEDKTFRSSAASKLKYLKAVPALKNVIREFAPEIVHAHYATSYGLIGALTGFHPYIISAWGSDLMAFPYKSIFHKKILKYIFTKADEILATSKTLASYAKNITSKEIGIIPFGVDTEKFKPGKRDSIFEPDSIVIGSIKSLEKIYGIDILINAFEKVHSKQPQLNLILLLVGSGSRETEYRQLVEKSHLNKLTIFTGRIPHNELVKYYNMIDIFVNVSYNESFGVSVLEASACEIPVIVSRVGGLTEVVEENKTGFLIEPVNVNELVTALEKMILNSNLRIEMGKAGREFVKANYEWNKSLSEMKNVYSGIILF